METIRIRKSGFAVRMSFEDFYEKYEFLIGRRKSDLANQIQEFLESLGFSNNDIQIGKTKVHVIIIILYNLLLILVLIPILFLLIPILILIPILFSFSGIHEKLTKKSSPRSLTRESFNKDSFDSEMDQS